MIRKADRYRSFCNRHAFLLSAQVASFNYTSASFACRCSAQSRYLRARELERLLRFIIGIHNNCIKPTLYELKITAKCWQQEEVAAIDEFCVGFRKILYFFNNNLDSVY